MTADIPRVVYRVTGPAGRTNLATEADGSGTMHSVRGATTLCGIPKAQLPNSRRPQGSRGELWCPLCVVLGRSARKNG